MLPLKIWVGHGRLNARNLAECADLNKFLQQARKNRDQSSQEDGIGTLRDTSLRDCSLKNTTRVSGGESAGLR